MRNRKYLIIGVLVFVAILAVAGGLYLRSRPVMTFTIDGDQWVLHSIERTPEFNGFKTDKGYEFVVLKLTSDTKRDLGADFVSGGASTLPRLSGYDLAIASDHVTGFTPGRLTGFEDGNWYIKQVQSMGDPKDMQLVFVVPKGAKVTNLTFLDKQITLP